MPLSVSQYRASTGAYQNRIHNNFRNNSTPAQSPPSHLSAIQNEIYRFGNNTQRAVNSHRELHRLSSQNMVPRPGITAPLLMLLSTIRVTDSPVPAAPDYPVFVSDGALSLTCSENTANTDNNDYSYSSILNPVTNALYETGQFLLRHDPLKFPGAEAMSVLATEKKSEQATDITNNIKSSTNYLSDYISRRASGIIDNIKNDNEVSIIKTVIKKLNHIAIAAEKKFPSDSAGFKNIDHLIYLIDKSKYIIDEFEIKYNQESICSNFRSQQEFYIDMASDFSDDESVLKFKKYIESIPSLTFTPDSRGEMYQSVETQIAGNLVRSFFWFQNDQGYSAAYGHRYDAYKYLLACILAEKKIDNINKLPDNWYKGDEAVRLMNLLFRDVEYNLKNKGKQYFLKAAEMLYLSLREEYLSDSTLGIKGLEAKTLPSYSDDDKLLALMHYFNQPVEIEYNQEPRYYKLFKLLDLLVTMQSIAVVMRPGSLSMQRGHSHSHDFKSRTHTHAIGGNKFTGKAGKLRLEYDNKTHELTINPTHRKNKDIHAKNHIQIQELLNNNQKIRNIKFKTNSLLDDKKPRSYISKEMKNKISPSMYEKNIHAENLSPPDHMGLRYDQEGNKYLKVNRGFVKIHHMESHDDIKNRYYIKDKNKQNLYLRFRKDGKFHYESYREHLEVIKKIGLGGKVSKAAIPSNDLTRHEISALHGYGRVDYSDINDLMRAGVSNSNLPPFILEPMVKNIEDIQHALKKIPPYEGVVYRGTSISREHFNSLHVDQIVTSKAFLSCSIDPAIAQRFSISDYRPHSSIIYEFNIKKSGHSISLYTLKPYEKEVLIENNKYFKIRNIDTNKIIFDEMDSSLLSQTQKSTAGSIDFLI